MKPARAGDAAGFDEGLRRGAEPSSNDTTLPVDPQRQPSHGSLEMLRGCIAECLHLSALYAGMGVDYAAVQDDAGLDYSIRCAVAHLRQAVEIQAMLRDQKTRDAARREAADAR